MESIQEFRKPEEVILESGFNPNSKPTCTLESVVQSKSLPLKLNPSCLEKNILQANSFPTLDPVLISTDVSLSAYWNKSCKENQFIWWLPHQIELPEQGSLSSNVLSNYKEVESNFWKKKSAPICLTQNNSLHISLPSVTQCIESEVVKGTRKIRLYPKSSEAKEELLEIIRQQRRAYNLAIGCFEETDRHPELRTSPDLSKIELRKTIREFVKSEVEERDGFFFSSGLDESVLSAFVTRDAIIRERRKGKRSGFSFRSKRTPRQGFLVQKLSLGFLEKRFNLTEEIPEEAFGKLTRFIYEHGRWYVCAQKHIETVSQTEIQGLKVVAIDPGVRTFATIYSSEEATKYGEGFFQNRILPLLLRLDGLISQRAKSKNDQWKAGFHKKISRLRSKIKGRIEDLHKKVAFDLVKNYDVILLPSFEVSQMTSKATRKILSKTVRAMLGLNHYSFELVLKWMAKKYGKRVVICNEAFTSKTRSWDGVIDENLGSQKVISDGIKTVDRDINGARGILLRALYGT